MDIVELVTNFLPLVRETSAWVCTVREQYISASSELDAVATECLTINANLSVLLALYKTTTGVGQIPDEAEIWMQMKVEITSCEETIKFIRRKAEPYGLETSVKVKYVTVGEDASIAKQLDRLRGHHTNLTTSLSVLITHNMQRASQDTKKLRELYTNQLDTLRRVLDQPTSLEHEGASSPNASLTSAGPNGESTAIPESASELNVYVMSSAPYLRHLVKDRQRVEVEKKQLEGKNNQLREDKRRLKNEMQQLEVEKRKLISDNKRLEEDKSHLEKENKELKADKQKLEDKKIQLQDEKIQLLEEKKQLQKEKTQLEEDKRQLQVEKRRLQDEKRQLQEEKRRLEEEKAQLQEDKRRLEKGQRRLERERRHWISERDELKEEKELLEQEWVGERLGAKTIVPRDGNGAGKTATQMIATTRIAKGNSM